MGIVWTIIVGFVVGLLAKMLHPGRDQMGFIMTTGVGIAGALVATFAGQALGIYEAGRAAGMVGAVIGAIAILAIYGRIKAAG